MHISPEQAQALKQPVIDAFPARTARFLQAEYPALARRVGPQALDAFVAHGLQRAAIHGFASERDIVQYLLVMLHLGPRFDEDAALIALQPFLDPRSPMQAQWRLNVLIGAARRRPEPEARRAH